MAYRHIMIESPAKLSLKHDQLIIFTDQEHSVPIEDISALLLENPQISITNAVLSALGQNGVAVFTCDAKHIPCAVQTPFMQHSRSLSVVQSQLEATEPAKKQRESRNFQPVVLVFAQKKRPEIGFPSGFFGSQLYHTKNYQGTK